MLKKIEKKVEQIENKINGALEKLAALALALWFAIVPKPLLAKLAVVKVSATEAMAKAKKKVLAFKGENVEKLKSLMAKQKLKSEQGPEKKILFKQTALDQVDSLKAFLLKTPLKHRADDIAKALAKVLDKTSAIPKTQALIAASAMIMIFFGTYSVYVSSQKIYMQEWGVRAPASADQYLDRPEYRKYPDRTLKVFNIKIPVYVESVSAVQSVTVDFTVRTDTRFAKQFLEEYEYKLKDYFFMTTEPMISSFPLEDEGKMVLKDKIQYELNIFLREERVEGEVLDVDIIFIVGS